jgi:hypothetical protein
VATSSSFIPHVSSPAMAEELAMLHGLLFAHSLGFQDILAESDSLEVINMCSGQDRIWNDDTAIYADMCRSYWMSTVQPLWERPEQSRS